MNLPNLTAIAQAALHEVVIARLIIAIIGEPEETGKMHVRDHGPTVGAIPAPGNSDSPNSFSVRPDVAERISKFARRRT